MKPNHESVPKKDRWTAGKIGYALLWLLGVPLPIVLVLYACHGGN